MALWCYLLSNWDINNLKVNSSLTGVELQRAQKMLAAAKDIYVRGTAWNKIYSPRVTAAPDRDTAYAKTAAEIALPGCSEHQSGLCADLHNLPAASQSFESKEAYKWLIAHCADFGFILRYPKDKEDVTEIIFEPWHYRFVGRYHASEMHRLGMCLEEYVAYLETAE